MICGIKNGEMRPGPTSRSLSQAASIEVTPPTPEPTTQPTRAAFSPVISSPEASWAIRPAASMYCWKGSSRRASLRSIQRKGSKPFTSPAMRVS